MGSLPWFHLANVGGPLRPFSLAVVDKLTSSHLVGSTFVASTGFDRRRWQGGPDRWHRPQDGAAQRPARQCFWCPRKNCYEASSDSPPGLKLVKVETLSQAVGALHAMASNSPTPSC